MPRNVGFIVHVSYYVMPLGHYNWAGETDASSVGNFGAAMDVCSVCYHKLGKYTVKSL
jgi:hypothetical protein